MTGAPYERTENMLGALRNPPKVVTVRVNKAVALRNTYLEGKKHRRDNYKWKVKVKGGKKTLESYTINDPNGNPIWDFEATFEIVDVSQPVVIKITDSDDHDVGQVVIPLVQIPPRPLNSSSKPMSDSNIRIGELEPTRKVSEVYGKIYYWIWAESFYEDCGPEKSSRGSLINLDKVQRSASRLSSHLRRRKDRDDGASVAGSQISMYSTASQQKKHWYKQNPIRKLKEHHSSGASHLSSNNRHGGGGSEIGYSMSQSMSSLFPQEHGGGAGGGHSGNGSEIFGGSNLDSSGLDFKMPTPENPFPRVGSTRRSGRPLSSASELSSDMPPSAQRRPSGPKPPKPDNLEIKGHSPLASSDEGEDTQGQPFTSPIPQSVNSLQDSPELISISPCTGSPGAETEVHVYGRNLSSTILRHAVLLVDDYTVANYKWSVSEGSWSEEPQATHRITFRVPPRRDALVSEKVWIDVETMSHGRLRCPVPFAYCATESPFRNNEPPAKLPESTFNRNSSIRLSDNRARRSICKPPEATPLKAISPPTVEGSAFVRNSSIRLSDTRAPRGNRGSRPPQPTLPPTNEIPSSIGNRSSGLGSEDSFSESYPPLSSMEDKISRENVTSNPTGDPNQNDPSKSHLPKEPQTDMPTIVPTVKTVEATSPKTERSGFVRNSSIRLSDTRSRRSMREPTKPVNGKPTETPQIAIPGAQAVDATSPKPPEPPKEEKIGFVRNSSIRLSDIRSRRGIRESKPSADSSKENEAYIPSITSAIEPVEGTPPKPLEPVKPESKGFVRNSSIRLSDTRARRGIRENKPDAIKEEPIAENDVAYTAAVREVDTSVTSEPPKPVKKGGFIRNSSIRLSDMRTRRNKKESEQSPPEPPLESNTHFESKKTEEASKTKLSTAAESDQIDGSSDIDDNGPPYRRTPQETTVSTPVKIEFKATSGPKDKEDGGLFKHTTPPPKEKERSEPIGGDHSSPIKESTPVESESEEEAAGDGNVFEKFKEEKEEESDGDLESVSSTESLNYSADSARGDSILPTMDESSYSQLKEHPRFVLMDPQEGSTSGGYEVCLYGIDLDEKVMLHAQVFVDVYAVSSADWRIVTGKWPNLAPEATHCLLIRVPEMPPGEAWIEVETMSGGRLQCPRPFVFSNRISSVKFSMRGMGGVGASKKQQQQSLRQPARSFADFELSPMMEEEKTANTTSLSADTDRHLDSAKAEISHLYDELSRLKLQLQNKSQHEVLVSRQLCLLQSRLLEDGQLKYLEKI